MSVYERTTRVQAPLSAVWEFHSTVDGLVAVTPDWTGLRVEAVRRPDDTAGGRGRSGDGRADPDGGEPDGRDPEVLVEGSEVDLSVRPFGVGPRSSWTSRIVERRSDGEAARFVDEMVRGPFARWRHTHSFEADGEDTLLRDRVEYRLPGGRAGATLSPLAVVGFEPAFRYRHRRTRRLLE